MGVSVKNTSVDQWRNYGQQWRAAASGRQPGGGASRPVLKLFILPENNINIVVDLRLVALQLISCVSFTHAVTLTQLHK